jgi:hypothetical protein
MRGGSKERDMKSMKSMLVAAAIGATGLAMSAGAWADHSGGHGHGGGFHGGGFHGGGFHGGGFHGGHFHSGVSFFFGVPWFWPGYYGYPYYYSGYPYYYGYPYGVPYGDGGATYEDVPTTQVPQAGPGAPSQGPLYMNYCASAKAYYPKVTQCPEGWKFITPQ